jgi:AcrR family transcriptional regulator
MAPRASCKTCDSRERASLEALRASGTSFAELARRFGQAEPTIRRHFKRGHARAAAVTRRAPAVVTTPAAVPRHPKASDPDPEVSFAKVRQAAAFLNVPLGELALCLTNHLEVTVTTASAAEEEELFAAWAAAEDDDDFVAAVIRSGRFYEETA